MKLLEFTENSAVTAIYPNRGAFGGLTYVLYGLCGELGEVMEIIKKIIRDSNGTFTNEKIERIKSEVGDVLWYWSQLTYESNTNIEVELDADELQKRIHSTFIENNSVNMLDPSFVFLQGKLISSCYIYAGQALDALNQVHSSDDIETEIPKISQLNTEIFKILCVFLANLDIKVSDVMQRNLDKLSARKDAGKIQGSGENLDDR